MSSISAIGGSISYSTAALQAPAAKSTIDKDGDKDTKAAQSQAGADKDGDASTTAQPATSATVGNLLSISA